MTNKKSLGEETYLLKRQYRKTEGNYRYVYKIKDFEQDQECNSCGYQVDLYEEFEEDDWWQCETCQEWYHFECKQPVDEIDGDKYCSDCIAVESSSSSGSEGEDEDEAVDDNWLNDDEADKKKKNEEEERKRGNK